MEDPFDVRNASLCELTDDPQDRQGHHYELLWITARGEQITRPERIPHYNDWDGLREWAEIELYAHGYVPVVLWTANPSISAKWELIEAVPLI